MLQAVAFDMDGLMFDTERLGYRSWERAANDLGITGITDLYEQMIGANEAYCRDVIKNAYHRDDLFDQLRDLEHGYRMELIETNGLPVKPGLLDLLSDLKERHIPMAVASSSKRETIDRYLELAGLSGYFYGIISGEQVKRSKPDPEIYQKACALLGVAPETCAALEDSYNGIRSAYAGRLLPIMVPDLIRPDREMEAKAHIILPDLFAVRDYLRTL